MRKKDIKKELAITISASAAFGAYEGFRSAAGWKNKVIRSLAGLMREPTQDAYELLQDYFLSSEYKIKQHRKNLELRILNKKFRMEKIGSMNSNENYFYASLVKPSRHSLEATVQFTEDTSPLHIHLERWKGAFVLNSVTYNERTIYERTIYERAI
jgi:hypothetical protein